MWKQRDGFAGEQSQVLPRARIEALRRSPLTSALYLAAIGYYPRATWHYCERSEPIDEYILIYCMEGSGYFTLSGGGRCPVGRNQYFVVPPGVTHSYGADEHNPWTIYWVHYGGTLADTYAPTIGVAHDIVAVAGSGIAERLRLFETMYRALEWGYTPENMMYAGAVLHHFLASFRFLQQFTGRWSDTVRSDSMDTAIRYMRENLDKHLSVSELAAYVGYSVSHFVTLFHERTGMSPIAFFNRLKVRHACYLLDTTQLKINQICHKVGMDDCFYFSRVFRREMGMSPSEYRNRSVD